MRKIDIDALSKALKYCPESGRFTWAQSKNQVKEGDTAGTRLKNGYVVIGFGGGRHLAHRLAWVFMNGVWPEGQIDHINGVRDDNRAENLRDVGRHENMQNMRKPQSNNKSGLLGVCWAKRQKRWHAQICINGKQTSLGFFMEKGAAYEAYLKAKRALHAGCTI